MSDYTTTPSAGEHVEPAPMRTDGDYHLDGETAGQVYSRLEGTRQAVVDMGRLMAGLTIPSLFPPDGYNPGDNLPGLNQSAAAGLVNGLASTLMLLAFPPGQPIAKFEVKETRIQQDIDADPELYGKTLLALSRLELSHRKRIASTSMTTAYTEFMKQLIVAGNALWKQLRMDSPRSYRCDSYVCKRNTAGLPLFSILREVASLQALDRDHRDFILSKTGREYFGDRKEWEKEVDVYSVCKLKTDDNGDHTWCYWEEWEGHILPDTEVETDFEAPPQYPAWLVPVYGKDWGRGYCEEHRGDLFTIEAAWSGLVDGTAVAALALIFGRTGAQTSIRQFKKARNLSVLPGEEGDWSVFRSDKGADFNFVLEIAERVERRLGKAFLQYTALQRAGERVTAEEWKLLANDINKMTGGLYTQISQQSQRFILLRAFAIHSEEDNTLPELPEDIVDVQVSTGVDALGNSTDFDNLVEYAAAGKAAFPETFEAVHRGEEFFTRLAAAKGVKPDGLVKTPEEIQQDQQGAQQQGLLQSMVDKGTGPAVKGLSDAMMAQQQQPAAAQGA